MFKSCLSQISKKTSIFTLSVLSASLPVLTYAMPTTTPTTTPSTTESFFDYAQQNAPEDTLIYVQSSMSQQSFISNLEGLNEQKLEDTQIHSIAQLYAQLLLDMKSYIAEKKTNQLMTDYGFDQNIDYAFYLEGPAPVVHVSLKNATQFGAKVKSMLKTYNLPMTSKLIKGREFLITDLKTDLSLKNVLYIKDTMISLAVMPKSYTDAQLLEVMGVTKGVESVFTNQSMDLIEAQYGAEESTTGFVNFVQTVNTLFGNNPKISSEYLFDLDKKIDASLNQVCKNEVTQLLQNVPSMVFGYKNTTDSKNRLTVDVSTTFDVQHALLKNELMSLNGHLMPSNKNAGLSMSVGLNIRNLLTTLNAWQQRAKQTEYKCEQLSGLMAVLKDENNLQWAAMLSTVQSIKGLHMSVFDLDFSKLLTGTFSMDMLVSITSDYPQLLLLLTKTIPFLSDLSIANDGSATTVETPLLFDPALKASLQGKHITLFTGARSEKYAQQLKSIGINKKGIMNVFVDYIQFSDLYLKNIPSLAQTSNKTQQQCVSEYQTLSNFKKMGMLIDYQLSANNQGVNNHINSEFNLEYETETIKTGKLDIQYLDTQCQWGTVGEQTFNDDYTGGYAVKDINAQCDLTQVDYSWTLNESAIEFVETKNQSRESCDQAFVENEKDQYKCHLLDSNNQGFMCYIQNGDVVDLYRYQ